MRSSFAVFKIKDHFAFLLALAGLLAVGLACGKSTPAPPQYVGVWSGQDGTRIVIRADGSGDYNSGSSHVTNGNVTIDEGAKSLKITLAGLGPSYSIDKPPAGDQMTLSGVVFKRNGGNSDTTPDVKSSPSNDDNSGKRADEKDIPSQDEIQDLAHSTTTEFADAIDTGDFSKLYDGACKDFHNSVTEQQFKDGFKKYLDHKDMIVPILRNAADVDLDFSPFPSFRTEKGVKILVVTGSYKVAPRSIVVDYEYENEGGEWKMLGLTTNVK